MQESMYSALFGAMNQEFRLDIIANNLANANTTGYKTDKLAFKDVFVNFAHDNIREPVMNLRSDPLFPRAVNMAKPRIAVSRTDFSQGSLQQSDNPLDMAISGEGFFKIRTDNGDFYSRDGHFTLNNEGLVVNGRGQFLLGDGGPIAIPPGTASVVINSQGQLFADGNLVDTVQKVTVDNLDGLEKFGQNMFKPRTEGAVAEQPADGATIEQGFLEKPNVEVVTEMVNMIETQRAFEAYQKTITNSQETDLKAIQQVGTVR